MNRFRTVFGFELSSYLKNKVIIGVTIFLVLASAIMLSFPRFTQGGGSGTEPDASADRPVMLIIADGEENTARMREVFAEVFPGYDVREAGITAEEAQEQIRSGGAGCAFVFTAPDACTYYVDNLGMNDTAPRTAAAALQAERRRSGMIENGVAPEKADEILAGTVSVETVKLGKDQSFTFFYTYIMIFSLYMVILMYGQMIATNVANEKSSRTMELLVTSVNTNAMIFGKVLASCLVGFLQLGVIFGSSILFFNLNKEFWTGNAIISSIFNPPPALLLHLLLFFFLGFLVYAFLYGAVGSTVSRLEDANTAVMPVTMLFMISFFLVFIPLASGDVESTLMKICSFVPFTSPMAMFTRIGMSSVPPIEIAISVMILALSALLIGFLSARIYRAGVLLYGVKPTPAQIIAMLKKEKQA